jgi:hypothetical protein
MTSLSGHCTTARSTATRATQAGRRGRAISLCRPRTASAHREKAPTRKGPPRTSLPACALTMTVCQRHGRTIATRATCNPPAF